MAHLDKDERWIGEWNVPGTSKKVPGTLLYAGGQIRLELLDPLPGVENYGAEIIHGRTNAGLVTVTDVAFNRILPTHGVGHLAVFGMHAKAHEKVFKVSIGFDLLKEWAIPSRPHKDALQIYDPNNMSEFGKGSQETFESQLDDDVKCTLVASLGFSHHFTEGSRQYHTSWFVVESELGLSLKDTVIKYASGLRDFLMTVMGRPIKLSEFHVLTGAHDRLRVYLPVERRATGGSELDHFFNARALKGNFDGVLHRWFDLYRRGPYYLDRFFHTFDSPYTNPLNFSAYSAVMEMCYEASTSRSSRRDGQERVIKWALEHFKDDFDNLDDFEKKVSAFRNALVHYKPNHDMDDDDLYQVTRDFFYLIRVILIEQCGVQVSREHNWFGFLQKTRGSKRFSPGPGCDGRAFT